MALVETFKGQNSLYGMPLVLNTFEAMKIMDSEGSESTNKSIAFKIVENLEISKNHIDLCFYKRVERSLKTLVESNLITMNKKVSGTYLINTYKLKKSCSENR